MKTNKFWWLLSVAMVFTLLLSSCGQKKHHDHKDKGCCKMECCAEQCCGGEKCGDDGCMMSHKEKGMCAIDSCCSEGSKCEHHKVTGDSATSGSAGVGGEDPAATAKYFCPMKCEGGYSDKPGKCVKCGMDLKERK